MRIGIVSGASSGIGKCIAELLDNYCLDEIWLIGRRSTKLEALKSMLYTKSRIFAIDLSNADSLNVIKSAFESNNYSVDFLVCSAGVGYNGDFDSISLDNIADMIAVNCSSLGLLTKIALPYMNEDGKIINIASVAGFLPQPGFAVYSATKAFVISLSRALRAELKQKRIKVTAVCPGPVDTEFFSGLKDVKEYKKRYLISTKRVAEGALKAVFKNKAIYKPTFSMKLVHIASKLLPTGLILKFMK